MNLSAAVEAERLAALASFDIMDSAPSASLNALVDSVRDIFGVAACAVTLLDSRRVWFKAVSGLAATEIARDQAFCDHTIRSDEILIVEDALRDDRFSRSD